MQTTARTLQLGSTESITGVLSLSSSRTHLPGGGSGMFDLLRESWVDPHPCVLVHRRFLAMSPGTAPLHRGSP
jgi:hypothetical protein